LVQSELPTVLTRTVNASCTRASAGATITGTEVCTGSILPITRCFSWSVAS
jgi:hypothetical protein